MGFLTEITYGCVLVGAKSLGPHVRQRTSSRHHDGHTFDEVAGRTGRNGLVAASTLELRFLGLGELVRDGDAGETVVVRRRVVEEEPVLVTWPLANPPTHPDIPGGLSRNGESAGSGSGQFGVYMSWAW